MRALQQPLDFQAVLCWGLRPNASRAEAYAAKHGLPLWRLEDGFLRSVGLGSQDSPLSIVLDKQGIYYDATRASALEAAIATPLASPQMQRAQQLMQSWRKARVSKYNHLRDPALSTLPRHFVLVADQTFGDASIRYGLGDTDSFKRMLDAALHNHPDCTVLVKIHPDVFAGRKRGHFDVKALAAMPRVQVLADDVHPVALLEHAEAVYTVTSQIGFEALLWDKPVYTFGMPFYAGWGLTHDALPAPARRQPVPLEQLVHAALVEYPRYLDPETGQRCEVERLVEWMGLQRRMRTRLPKQVYALGFSRRKRPIAQRFLDGSQVVFTRHIRQVPAGATVALWGRNALPQGHPDASSLHIVRIEDGFLRSVGLGADLVQPLSWIVDAHGIYYDATTPSGLELLLKHTQFTPALCERAAALRAQIVQAGITKYNTGSRQAPPLAELRARAGSRAVLLVIGQVESDAALAWGAPATRTNIGLLQAVRNGNPDAYVIYKPHPDVQARLRAQGQGEGSAAQYCDEVLPDVPLPRLLDGVDEVHVMTSLAGFEALLRGRKVVTHGCPFYAGWGLTEDLLPMPRRQRPLTLDELVAGALILYPTYVSQTSGRFSTPERTLQELIAWRARGISTASRWLRVKRILLRAAQQAGWIKR
ncbi:capsular polysaccharide biosynthesis protein [Lampropedia cohaerens]|uniref:capsular polysaccharide biosynthesis protein n=1 Tax=Lampropedia cohaerens TaxID=1610491 RepID=UPI001E619A0D|nr:capsular polysaccharide biosynthesis protein [Lampropedia cohaerens]